MGWTLADVSVKLAAMAPWRPVSDQVEADWLQSFADDMQIKIASLSGAIGRSSATTAKLVGLAQRFSAPWRYPFSVSCVSSSGGRRRRGRSTISATFGLRYLRRHRPELYQRGAVRLRVGKERCARRALTRKVKPFINNADWYGSLLWGRTCTRRRTSRSTIRHQMTVPIPGFLYASFGLAADRKAELDLIAIDIGVVGDALAKRRKPLSMS